MAAPSSEEHFVLSFCVLFIYLFKDWGEGRKGRAEKLSSSVMSKCPQWLWAGPELSLLLLGLR